MRVGSRTESSRSHDQSVVPEPAHEGQTSATVVRVPLRPGLGHVLHASSQRSGLFLLQPWDAGWYVAVSLLSGTHPPDFTCSSSNSTMLPYGYVSPTLAREKQLAQCDPEYPIDPDIDPDIVTNNVTDIVRDIV